MLPEIENAYRDGRLMLLLGAGASAGSRDSNDKLLPMGDGLAEELSTLMNWAYQGESLSKVYAAIETIDSARLHSFLRTRLWLLNSITVR